MKTRTQSYPPGFEGEPRYKRNAPKEIQPMPSSQSQIQSMPSYSAIQQTCAKKLNIFLPTAGYCHIVLKEDSIDKIYEMAYRNEFKTNATRPVSTLGEMVGTRTSRAPAHPYGMPTRCSSRVEYSVHGN